MLDPARVQKELHELRKDATVTGITVKPAGDTLAHLVGSIAGPIDTPYDGGTFLIDIVLPDQYPYEPPKMRFITKHELVYNAMNALVHLINISSAPILDPELVALSCVRHPNISSQNGAICLDILKDQWSPALNMKTALLSLQALLSAPEPNDPQDAVVAQQYLREYKTFIGTARYWTEAFAMMASVGIDEKVQKLTEMGFPEALVRSTLEGVNGDENLALEKLCMG
ncbi:Ubiquitin-conjugating enzyme E2 27-like protein [Drosera capensis]